MVAKQASVGLHRSGVHHQKSVGRALESLLWQTRMHQSGRKKKKKHPTVILSAPPQWDGMFVGIGVLGRRQVGVRWERNHKKICITELITAVVTVDAALVRSHLVGGTKFYYNAVNMSHN